jgi:hypothetical protein
MNNKIVCGPRSEACVRCGKKEYYADYSEPNKVHYWCINCSNGGHQFGYTVKHIPGQKHNRKKKVVAA